MPSHILDRIDPDTYDLVSTDLFDTVLMRDLSLEETRLDEAARLAAARLDLNPDRVSALRRSFHRIAYMAVAAERPSGDASIAAICRTVALAIGGGPGVAETLRDAEVETDMGHLSPNRPLLDAYGRLAKAGKRIVATTDTYYSTEEIGSILSRVVGEHPFSAVYASCDIGLTKHAGKLFAEVARREGVHPTRILHVGDDPRADVRQARSAGCIAVHLPRAVPLRRAGKVATRLTTLLNRIGD